jgi:predicted lipoprotein with Yx(FWY)xxD motif
MTRTKSMTFLAVAAALSVAAPAATAPAATSARTATVHVASTSLGKILVDSHGRTLYLFKRDTGTSSKCSGACAAAWPPLRASGKPTAAGGAKAALVKTTKRSDGQRQVTYNGHPVYRFIGDTKPGDTNGEGLTAFGGRWYAVSAAGKQVTGSGSGSGAGGSTGY